MKSMLQQEVSITKAIQKAWDISGQPSEFTVKIINKEVKNILGFLKRPAVISFSYNPKLSTVKVKYKEIVEKPKQEKILKPEKTKFFENTNKVQDSALWKKEFIEDVKIWVNEILTTIGFKVGFDFGVDNKMLNIYLDRRILKDKEDEKMFFISLSNLLMQFLKRKYRKKFANYYLIIHSKK
jgi:predicted RNA-binding protein Jag